VPREDLENKEPISHSPKSFSQKGAPGQVLQVNFYVKKPINYLKY